MKFTWTMEVNIDMERIRDDVNDRVEDLLAWGIVVDEAAIREQATEALIEYLDWWNGFVFKELPPEVQKAMQDAAIKNVGYQLSMDLSELD